MATSNQIRHAMPSSWAGRAHRSQAAVPAAVSRRHSPLLRNEAVSRFTWPTLAARFESKTPSITNFSQRSRFPSHTTKIRAQSRRGLAAWQQVVIVAYIEKHIAESMTVPALARFVYLTSNCFSRAFKRSFGIPPHRYIIQQRIERGKTLLAGSAWSIVEIGLALGFSRTSSFSAAFRKITGLSPTEYRLSQQ